MEGMDRAKLILEVTGDTVRGNGPKSPSGRLRLDMRKHFFPWRGKAPGTSLQEGAGPPFSGVSGFGWAKP